MSFELKMPKLGHAMTEGTLVKWHKQEGERVEQGDVVLTVETDKAEVEVDAPSAGVLRKCVAVEGQTVPVGGTLGEIETGTDAVAQETSSSQVSAPLRIGESPGRRVAASPRARRLAAERGLDLSSVVGSGGGGLITEEDVKRAAAEQNRTGVQAPAEANVSGAFRREKLTRIQSVGARNLTASWQTIPHFVQMQRVDMSAAIQARSAAVGERARVSLTGLIAHAAVRALTENPRVNASYSDGAVLIYEHVNLGVAVDTPEGLVVPVIHTAEQLDPALLSARIDELAERARTKRLSPQDLEGATFTLSNLGGYGVENGTPVILPPQSALMFTGVVKEEVLAVNGEAKVRPAMHVAIAYDHRGIDGATASRFTTRVKELLESVGSSASEALNVAKPREVVVESTGTAMRTEVRHGSLTWRLSAEDSSGPDPVTSFLGALGSCLLMSLRVAADVRNFELGRASVVARSNEKGRVREISVELRVETREPDDKLHQLIEVAERGCHIRQLISNDIPVRLTVERT
ncbi:MAG TPA: 2-oxo acid dehydrogenase subunit E2 [Candidatus Binataceae bacterium]|nr:2-oxo acid dehydrogenase subunit E2 [Candidatus Binataceae bacterium]